MSSIKELPQFYFPKCVVSPTKQINNEIIMNKVTALYENREYLTEIEFQAITNICSLPKYMNIALFRAIDSINNSQPNNQIILETFKKSWPILTKDHGYSDMDSLIYYILKKPDFDWMTPDDFLPVLEDIVLNHPALQFLENNITFQERYIETVICRIFYDAHCPTGKLSLKQFRKSGIASILQSLDPSVDLYTIHNVFSYKQFYVLYCKLWSLDTDHDLSLSETDLCNYNMGTLARLTVERIMEIGHVIAFTDPPPVAISDDDAAEPRDLPPPSLTYFDFIWFLLSEVDKSTSMAIEYWFRCLDIDDDGVLSAYELNKFWQDQDLKQKFYGSIQADGNIQFEDIIRQMNDLIQPHTPGQFLLKDLKKNGYLAERFFDTFINFDRFQVHESHQEGSIREQQYYEHKQCRDNDIFGAAYEPVVLTDDLGFPVLSNWDDYADVEYHRIILDENYVNSYEDDCEEEDDSVIKCQQEGDEDEGVTILHCSGNKTSPTITTSADDDIVIEEVNNVSNQNINDTISSDSSINSDSSSSNSSCCDDDEDGLSDTLSISSSSSFSSSGSETHTPDLHDSNFLQATDAAGVPVENATITESENTENDDTFDEDDCSSLGGDTCIPNSPFINSPKDSVLYNNKRMPSSTEYFELQQKNTEDNSLDCIHQHNITNN